MTEVWVFLHTTVEPVIIVGEKGTDELITRREGIWLDMGGGIGGQTVGEAKREACCKKKASPCASFSAFTSLIRPLFSFSVFPMTSAAELRLDNCLDQHVRRGST